MNNQVMTTENNNNKGFSLVELIIVIAIMAILVGIVGTQVIPYLNRSREAKDQQILSAMCTAAVSTYASDAEEFAVGKYYLTLASSVSASADTGLTVPTNAASLFTQYSGMSAVPATTDWSSTTGKTIKSVKITIDTSAKTVLVQAYSDAAATSAISGDSFKVTSKL